MPRPEKERKQLEAAFRAARKGASEAVRVAKLPKRPPTDADRPRLGASPRKVIPGQTNIYEAIGEEVADDAA
jgi:hypothetical protein